MLNAFEKTQVYIGLSLYLLLKRLIHIGTPNTAYGRCDGNDELANKYGFGAMTITTRTKIINILEHIGIILIPFMTMLYL